GAAHDVEPVRGPGVAGGGQRERLARTGHAFDDLDSCTGGAHRAHHGSLFCADRGTGRERTVDEHRRDDAGVLVSSHDGSFEQPLFGGDEFGCGVAAQPGSRRHQTTVRSLQRHGRLRTVDGDHMLGRQEPGGQLEDLVHPATVGEPVADLLDDVATGSSPFVPPVPGRDADGCFVYRTIDDLEAIADFAAGCRTGAVIGGGLLGLEAANALRSLGLETHVVELAPRLMPVQVDDGGGVALRRRIEELGVVVHTGAETDAIVVGDRGQVTSLRFADGDAIDVDVVVFSAGIRPRDELARACGLAVGELGGVVVDERCRTEDERIYAIGECAHVAGRTWGLVGPGYQMAKVVADQLAGSSDGRFAGADLSTKLKLLGVDVASFGDPHGTTPGCRAVTYDDPVANVYRRVVVDPDGPRVLGGVLVGDASGYDSLVQMARGDVPAPADLGRLALPASQGGAPSHAAGELAEAATVCSCNNVTKGEIVAAVAGGATDVAGIRACTRAGTGCGGCVPMVTDLLQGELRRAGGEVRKDLCEHFAFSRQELFDLVRVEGITTFSELLARHGRGLGCEICKPAVASMLASLGNGYILDGEQAALQDTNDHFLANLQ